MPTISCDAVCFQTRFRPAQFKFRWNSVRIVFFLANQSLSNWLARFAILKKWICSSYRNVCFEFRILHFRIPRNSVPLISISIDPVNVICTMSNNMFDAYHKATTIFVCCRFVLYSFGGLILWSRVWILISEFYTHVFPFYKFCSLLVCWIWFSVSVSRIAPLSLSAFTGWMYRSNHCERPSFLLTISVRKNCKKEFITT